MTDAHEVFYGRERDLAVEAFARVLDASGLGATRPTRDLDRLARMLDQADLIVTARGPGPARPLLGVARCVTDFAWCAYLSELAVAHEAQGLGVGAGLIAQVRQELGPEVCVVLASMPDAVGFYERIGMPRLQDAFWYPRQL